MTNNDGNNLFSIHFKVDPKLRDAIEYRWRDQQYRNRDLFLTDAIEEHLTGVRCPQCNALNPKGGRVCSVCLHPLEEGIKVNTTISDDGVPEVKPVRNMEKTPVETIEDRYEGLKKLYSHIPEMWVEDLNPRDFEKQKEYAEKFGMPLEDYRWAKYLLDSEFMENDITLEKEWVLKYLNNPKFCDLFRKLGRKHRERKNSSAE